METGIIKVEQAGMLEAINRAEVDVQITTAHAYPRDLQKVLNQIKTYATLDEETAQECFYVLPRGTGQIEGVSVRMAEIIAGAWGNLRVQSRIIGNDGKTLTAQAVCHDLESNLAVSVEVKRRITDRNGRTLTEDMQVVTGNAACAIAFRNAVLKVVPKAVTKKIMDEVKEVGAGRALDMTTSRNNVVKVYNSFGVTTPELLEYLKITAIDAIDSDMLTTLRGLSVAIKEGTTTVDDSIRAELKQRKQQKETDEKAKKVQEAMAKSAK